MENGCASITVFIAARKSSICCTNKSGLRSATLTVNKYGLPLHRHAGNTRVHHLVMLGFISALLICHMLTLCRNSEQPKQRGNFGAHFIQFFGRCFAFGCGFARTPVEIFDLIGQRRAANTFCTNDDFEGITLYLHSHRATQHRAGFAVVDDGAEHQRGAVACLLMPQA